MERALRTALTVLAAVLVVLSLAAGGAVAQSDAAGEPADAEDLVRLFEENRDRFNDRIEDVDLGPAGPRLSGKTTNVVVTDVSDEPVVWFSMDQQRHITEVETGGNPDADLVLETDNETIRTVLESDDPAAAFRDAYATDRIEIRTAYSFGEAVTGQKGPIVESVVDWGFWTAAETLKGLLF